ncbi:MAG: hypothetical protein C4525_04970 [Desulfarculus sp.]|nr:MAG: hypothetical protein C4525_04970 [Desulfarculus sp.]
MVLLALALAAGCASAAEDQFGKLAPGMTPAQVAKALGEPEHIKRVRFPGHKRDYLVMEYTMVPEVPT